MRHCPSFPVLVPYILQNILQNERLSELCYSYRNCSLYGLEPIGTAAANSVESDWDLRCPSMVYFDNVMLTSKKPCHHTRINKCDCSEPNGYQIPQ